ncbi:hypothetical protein KUTeg_013855 [Tegillarca granosa]|uniref:Uncharacterized protein n=1 Tax=Tegillarca granosa TaxID=220873 RepID=A0ABQ9EYE6_TEGGR|nr:hypothetical protein KUTeg_013855 [Tegillarca granosa]
MVVNLKCYGEKDDRELVGKEVRNTAILALSFALAFTAYKSIQMLQSSLNQKEGLGVTSLACVYACVIVSCICAPTVIKLVGGKLTLIIAWIAHSIYISSNFYPIFATLIPSSILLGLATGSLWTSQGLFLSSNGASLAKTKNQDLHAALSKLNGIFFTIHETSQFTGNIISPLVLNKGSYDEFQNVTKICGANSCPLSINATKIVEPGREVLYTLLGIYLVFDLMALFITLIFIPPLPKSKWSEEKSLKSSISSCFLALGDYEVLLLLPMFLFIALEQALFWADVTKIFVVSFISCPFGIHYVGYICATHGASIVVANFVLSRIVRFTGRHFLYALASVLNMTMFILFYFWTPEKHLYGGLQKACGRPKPMDDCKI